MKTQATRWLPLIGIALTTGSAFSQNLLTNGSFEDNYYANTGALPYIRSRDGAIGYLLKNNDGTGIGGFAQEGPGDQPTGWVAYAARVTGVHRSGDKYYGTPSVNGIYANGSWTAAGGIRHVDTVKGKEDPSIYQYGDPYAVPDQNWAYSAQSGTYFGQDVDFIAGETYTLSFMSRTSHLDTIDLGIGTSIDELYDPVTGTWQGENKKPWDPDGVSFNSNLGVVTYGDALKTLSSTGIIGEEKDSTLWRETTIEFTATEDMDGIYFAPYISPSTGYILLDDVRLTGPTPEPSVLLFGAISSLTLLSKRSRK